MSINLLFIPPRTTEPVDLRAVLTNTIQKDYFQPVSAFERDISTVDSLRRRIANISAPDITEDTLKNLLLYLTALKDISTRFHDDVCEFVWYPTLGYSQDLPVKSASLVFEQINVIYQLAAVYSNLATAFSRNSETGLKKSFQYFQYAAGCIAALAELRTARPELPTHDMSAETLSALEFLMLAQAQEMFWLRAVGDGKTSNTLVAKLAAQVSSYYSQAHEKAVVASELRSEWISHLSCKQYHFEAAAHLRMSSDAQNRQQYGEEVARLRSALAACSNALMSAQYVTPAVLDDLQGLFQQIKDNLARAERDNDMIYLQVVPAAADLSPIVPKSAVGSVKVAQLTGEPPQELFRDLTPYRVIDLAQAYRENAERYVSEELVGRCAELTRQLQQFLTREDLPARVDAVRKPQGVPASVLARGQDLRAAGGVAGLQEALAELRAMAEEDKDLLDEVSETLDVEQAEDIVKREQYGKLWLRSDSQEASEPLRKRYEQLCAYVVEAAAGDELIRSEVNGVKPHLELLASDEETLARVIPNAARVAVDRTLIPVAEQLEDLLRMVRHAEQERRQFTETVRMKSRQFDIVPKILSHYETSAGRAAVESGDMATFDRIYSSHMRNFESDVAWLRGQEEYQKRLMIEIQTANKTLAALHQNDPEQQKRQATLRVLEEAYVKFEEIRDNIDQGFRFYTELKAKVSSLLSDCQAYTNQRRQEGDLLENEILLRRRREEKLARRSARLNQSPSPSPSVVSGGASGAADRSVSPLPAPKPKQPHVGVWKPEHGIRFG